MKTTNRFDQAILKLYHAFHSGTLVPECNQQCAVGTILNNSESWKHFSDNHGSTVLNYVGLVNENFGRRFGGYKPSELLQIEVTFLKACGYQVPLHYSHKKPEQPLNKDTLFSGLTAVVSLLCKLDNLPDVMNCQALFMYKPKPYSQFAN
ncbi:Na(+)-translocating NADH-quinone reductase subunit F [Bizionia sediminis]|uniref:Na(+)-translocating NADH-quinone reductase subunit F n=1 Tax=Bizionia sediminis TaxID=1737064 RepID=A0ABW5KTK4_9FLAO